MSRSRRATIDRYFDTLGETMARESRLLAEVFAHPGKLGENREALVARFLATYLPKRFGVASGFALFGAELSAQQDIVVYDAVDNPVLFPAASAPLFPPSAIQALIEVKSTLDRRALGATARKSACVKHSLRASLAHHPEPPPTDPLVMLFAFTSTLTPVRILNELRALEEKERTDMRDRLDLVCVLGEGVVLGGSLMYATTTGQELREATPRPDAQRLAVALENSLFVFYARLLDYISVRPATPPQLMSYLPPDTPLGRVVAVG